MSFARMPVLGVVVALVAGLVACGRLGARLDVQSRVVRALDHLGATEPQRARIQQIVGKSTVDLEPWPDAVARLKADLRAAWRADVVDRAAVHQRVDQELEALRSTSHALIDDAADLHATLTPEQRERLARLASHRRR